MGDDNPYGDPIEWVKNVISHEFLHTAIDAGIPEVEEKHHPDQLDEGSEHVHHDLGFIHDNSNGDPASPLGTGYEDSHALHGCTQAPDWGYSYHEELSHCTTEAFAHSVFEHMEQ